MYRFLYISPPPGRTAPKLWQNVKRIPGLAGVVALDAVPHRLQKVSESRLGIADGERHIGLAFCLRRLGGISAHRRLEAQETLGAGLPPKSQSACTRPGTRRWERQRRSSLKLRRLKGDLQAEASSEGRVTRDLPLG